MFSDLWLGGGGDAREQGGDNLQDNGPQCRWKDHQVMDLSDNGNDMGDATYTIIEYAL